MSYLTEKLELNAMGKPNVAQVFRNFPTFYGTRRFIIVFTIARQCLYSELD
jgi:hypothetical protein